MTKAPKTYSVRTPQEAAIFSDPRRRWLMLGLIGAEKTLSAVAREAGYSLNLVHHHVSRFLSLGLVEVTRLEARAGRPIKYYRAIADRFFVQASLLSHNHNLALERELREAIEVSERRHGGSGVVFDLDETGSRRMKKVQEPSTAEAVECWKVLSLERSVMNEMIAEMSDVLDKYERRQSAGRPPYLIHLAAALRR